MVTQVQILQRDDVVWTIGKGQLRGWKCSDTGQMVELATQEIEAVMRTSDASRIRQGAR